MTSARPDIDDLDPTVCQPTVLIVDDYLTVAEIVERRLRIEGLRTRTCAAGREAIEAIRQGGVDLVVLDVMMPDVDGYEVIRAIRAGQRTRDLPVIMLTAKTRDEDVAKGLALGADAYVTKPFNGADLVRQVKRLLDQRCAA